MVGNAMMLAQGTLQSRCTRAALTLLIVAALGADPPPYVLEGKVVRIADGDTLTILEGPNAQHRIRLFGIDAPAKGQAFGTKAQRALADKVFSKTIRVEVVQIDRYGREVGRIYLGDRFINAEMVRDGFAWRYPQFDLAREFSRLETDAREHKRGLWADAHPVPPWEFRREKRQPAAPLHP
jgi:endonuclease YncB( thermonuclease family)